jgi:hypothetical protein
LTVDYERGNFSVSQCTWQDGAAPQIESILSSSYEAGSLPSPSPTAKSTTNSKKIAPGAIAGIVIGALVVVGAVLGLIYYFFVYRRKHSKPATEELANTEALPREYYGKELPANSAHQSPTPGYGQTEGEKSFPIPAHTTYEAPSSEIFQMASPHERSRSEGTSTILQQETPTSAGHYPHELEGSKPELSEMDDASSRGQLSPERRAQSPPSESLSPDTFARHGPDSPNFF